MAVDPVIVGDCLASVKEIPLHIGRARSLRVAIGTEACGGRPPSAKARRRETRSALPPRGRGGKATSRHASRRAALTTKVQAKRELIVVSIISISIIPVSIVPVSIIVATVSRRGVVASVPAALAQIGVPVGSVSFETGHVHGDVPAVSGKAGRRAVTMPRRRHVTLAPVVTSPVMGHFAPVVAAKRTRATHCVAAVTMMPAMTGHHVPVVPGEAHAMMGVPYSGSWRRCPANLACARIGEKLNARGP